MSVIRPDFTILEVMTPFIILFGGFAALFVVSRFVFKARRDTTYSVSIGAPLFVAALFSVIFFDTHHREMISDLETRFEQGYDLTIVKGVLPYNEYETPTALEVYLNDVAGPQTIIIDISDKEYIVMHDGVERNPVHDSD